MRITRTVLIPLLALACSLPAGADETVYFRNPLEPAAPAETASPQFDFELLEEAARKQEYQETILDTAPIDGSLLQPERYIEPPRSELPYLLRVRSGVSYFDIDQVDDDELGGSKVGGSYAIDGFLSVYHSLVLYGSFSGNHFSEGSQFLGTVGAMKVANPRSQHLSQRLGWGALFDQYTDTRVDDLYLSQVRLNANLALTSRDTLGLTWYEPVSRDAFIPFAAGPSQPLFSSQAIEGYLSHQFDAATLSASLAYRLEDSALVYGLIASAPVSDRVNLLAQYKYDDQGNWSNWMGVEITLGRKASPPACAYRESGQDVVRGSSEFSLGVSAFSLNEPIRPKVRDEVEGGSTLPTNTGQVLENAAKNNPHLTNQTASDFSQLINKVNQSSASSPIPPGGIE